MTRLPLNPRRLRRKLPFAIVAAIAATAVLAPMAEGTASQPASGGFILTGSTSTLERTADGNLIFSETNTGVLNGTFTGQFTVHLTRIVHTSAGFATFHGSGTFAGTVAGRAGTFDFASQGRGSATAPEFESSLESVGTGTGGLSGLHAKLTLHGFVPAPPFGVYEGTYHFN
jgi:Protein of unknown function (DUF3224)